MAQVTFRSARKMRHTGRNLSRGERSSLRGPLCVVGCLRRVSLSTRCRRRTNACSMLLRAQPSNGEAIAHAAVALIRRSPRRPPFAGNRSVLTSGERTAPL